MAEHRVVILGGGFGGLYAAKSLKHAPVDLAVVDRRNFHLFQPLLYQVATGSLSPGEISAPIRSVLSKQKNTRVMLEEAVDLDPQAKIVHFEIDPAQLDRVRPCELAVVGDLNRTAQDFRRIGYIPTQRHPCEGAKAQRFSFLLHCSKNLGLSPVFVKAALQPQPRLSVPSRPRGRECSARPHI